MTVSSEEPRLFKPFLDLTDMVMCRRAETSLDEINQEAAEHGLRFPLSCERRATLAAHMFMVEYAPNSARFGPFVDNVLGMNWQLNSGKVVRIGERVIKSATGYDLLRFLLHSDGRYGSATDYVLRLRPMGGEIIHALFTGTDQAIAQTCTALVKSSWIHWIDAVDLCLADKVESSLQLTIDCTPEEGDVFIDYLQERGRAHGVNFATTTVPDETGLPVLSLQAPRPIVTRLARRLVQEHGGHVRMFCVNGVIFYYPPSNLTGLPTALLADIAQQCVTQGGHLTGPWAPTALPREAEAAWTTQLENVWNQL